MNKLHNTTTTIITTNTTDNTTNNNDNNDKLSFQSSKNYDLEVIVVGLNKTGTSYLKYALELLYHGSPCFHYIDLIYQSNDNIEKWLELNLCQYQTKLNGFHYNKQELLRMLLKNYKTVSGIPITSFLSDLIQMYPNAKVILTVRNAELWHAACRTNFIPYKTNQSKLQKMFSKLKLCSWLININHIKLLSIQNTLGKTINLNNDNELIHAYSRYNDYVKLIVPNERLLIYNIKQGWLPLCEFLNKPIPCCKFPGNHKLFLYHNIIRYSKKLFHLFIYIFIYLFIIYYFLSFFR
ncbi:unnamed protein product [Schistosoma rodhaini]|uniref:Sulfotransfer_1 domain-containing protein n=1 Tax=Schistosoma mansoni TaxID=6183 RepID=A0A5K4FEK2_SCHMA|nr:unnamed protein product [Schistosoma rodhaini]